MLKLILSIFSGLRTIIKWFSTPQYGQHQDYYLNSLIFRSTIIGDLIQPLAYANGHEF